MTVLLSLLSKRNANMNKKIGQNRSEQVGTGQNKSVGTGRDQSELVEPFGTDQKRSEPVRTIPNQSELVGNQSEQVRTTLNIVPCKSCFKYLV